ncbi:MAG TPA: HPF/RaiA family ribosome-associated protein [Verrucomicrobiae bacterium]|nr:HPF/RaiA family ribosome-associated protein [Verrucomicrobiae bacterium]
MITWNIVTKNIQTNEVTENRLRQKLAKLEQHLAHYPPDAVHLQIALERHPRKPWHTAALTLRVPSNILHSEKGAADWAPAFDQAMKALLRELTELKARLRREPVWKRKERRKQLRATKLAAFAADPMAAGTGPQNLTEIVADLIQQEHDQLLRHVRRLIRQDELCSDLLPGAVDARAVVDEVARQAMAAPADKPDEQSYRVWIYDLARAELQRRIRAWRAESREKLPITSEEVVPDPRVAPPDVELARKEIQQQLQTVAQRWPAAERAIFELYFIEGFEPEEIMILTKHSRREVELLIGAVQTRLRWELEGVVE